MLVAAALLSLMPTCGGMSEEEGNDVEAPVSLDARQDEMPTNLVVFRDRWGGYAEASVQLVHEDGTLGDAQHVEHTDGLGQRFDVGALVLEPKAAYLVTLTDADDPERSRSLELVTGAGPDLAPPRIDGEPELDLTHHEEGFTTQWYGPIAYTFWQEESWSVVVEAPKVEDDVGAAAIELRAELDGEEIVLDLEIVGMGDGVLTAHGLTHEPKNVRVVALDHAGNESEAAELEAHEHAGCAQMPSVGYAPFAALLLVLAARRRRVTVGTGS